MTPPSTNRLLTALQTFRPGRILQMGDLRHVQGGIDLYERFGVEWLGWQGEERVDLRTGRTLVSITLNSKGHVVCNCESCGANQCGHSVAVMATVSHALRGKMGLSSKSFSPDTFEHIREALFEGPENPAKSSRKAKGTAKKKASLPPIRIIQDGNGELDAVLLMPRASLSLRGIGSFGSPAAIRQLPPDVRELFSVPMTVPHELEEVLFNFLQRTLGKYPVVIDSLDSSDNKPVPVEAFIDSPLAGLLLARRHADTGTVTMEFAATPMESTEDTVNISTAPPLNHFYRLGKTLIFVPEDRAIGLVLADEAWESQVKGDIDEFIKKKLFQRYHNTKERKPFQLAPLSPVPIEKYNQEPFLGNENTAGAVLVRYYDEDAKEPTSPVPTPAKVALDAQVNSRTGAIALAGKVDALADISSVFDAAAEQLERLDETAGSSYSRRRPLFKETRVAIGSYLLGQTPEERASIAETFLDLVDSNTRTKRMRYRFEATFEALDELLQISPDSPVLATLPTSDQNTPPWVKVETGSGIRDALAACYKYFPGFVTKIIDEPDEAVGAMTALVISASEWKEQLINFSSECERCGIDLTIDGKRIETVKLDFQVRADPVPMPDTQGQTSVPEGDRIDWFALHPKIFCDQVDVPQEQWSSILQGGTFHASGADGIIRVVDSESLERFALFLRAGAGLATGSSKKTGDGEEPVKVPRLQILDWMQLKKKGIEIVLPDEDAAIIDSLLSGKPGNPADMPDTIKATLRPYQIAGYRWMAFLYEHRFGAVLADDMGLGKTLQTITLLAALDAGLIAHRPKEKHPHLAVLPPSLVFNWRSEIERFLPGIDIYEYTGSKRSLEKLRKADVVLTTYELARRDIEKLEAERFDVIIFDEAQAVKNIAAARSKAIRRLNGRFRLCLTGTPLENHVGEYFAILDLALPGLFGEGEEAKKALRASAKTGDTGSERYLRRAQPFVLRRTKENVLKDLPPKVESDVYLDLERSQKEFYTRTVAEVRDEVAKAFAHKPKQQAGIVALSALMRLRQICVAPGVIDPSIKTGSAPKLDHLVEKLQELHQEGHAALVFSQFTRVLDLIEPQLAAADLDFVRLDGQTPQKMRKKYVDKFQVEDGPDVFLISLKAGGAGLNLTRASYVFHLDPWWNPAVERQASDRAHRIGQKNKVFIHRILMRETIEEKMMILKARKQELYDEIMGSAEAEGERIQSRKAPMITQEDIGFLLG